MDRDVCLSDYMTSCKLQHITRRTPLKIVVAHSPPAAPAASEKPTHEPLAVGAVAADIPAGAPSKNLKPLVVVAVAPAAVELLAQRSRASRAYDQAPTTSTEFESMWRSIRSESSAQRGYLQAIKPADLPQLFKSSLTAPVLFSIVEVLLISVGTTSPGAAAASAEMAVCGSGCESAGGLLILLVQLCTCYFSIPFSLDTAWH